MSERDLLADKIEAKIKEVNAEIEKLEAKALDAEADSKLAMEEKIAELRVKRDEAKSQLDQFQQSGNDALEDIERGVKGAWQELTSAIDSARDRF